MEENVPNIPPAEVDIEVEASVDLKIASVEVDGNAPKLTPSASAVEAKPPHNAPVNVDAQIPTNAPAKGSALEVVAADASSSPPLSPAGANGGSWRQSLTVSQVKLSEPQPAEKGQRWRNSCSASNSAASTPVSKRSPSGLDLVLVVVNGIRDPSLQHLKGQRITQIDDQD